MKIKKNIDDLFKERFENLEVSPSPEVWKNIQTKLKEEDDRKVIPIWIKLSGIAALLVLFFTIGNFLLNDSLNQTVTPIVFENKLNTKLLNETLQESTLPLDKTKANEDDYDAGITTKNTTEAENSNSKVIIANHKKSKESANPQNNSGELNNKIATSEIASAKPVSTNKSPQKDFINKEITVVTANESATAVQNSNNSKVENAEPEKIENKKSIFDAINETQEEATAIIVDNSPDHRWELIPNIAPVYYNTLSEGSSIDPMFSDNNKKGDLNVSYGIKVSYNLNKRVSIRLCFWKLGQKPQYRSRRYHKAHIR